jgi:hypothetical protein
LDNICGTHYHTLVECNERALRAIGSGYLRATLFISFLMTRACAPRLVKETGLHLQNLEAGGTSQEWMLEARYAGKRLEYHGWWTPEPIEPFDTIVEKATQRLKEWKDEHSPESCNYALVIWTEQETLQALTNLC